MSTQIANNTFKAYLGNEDLLLQRQAKLKQQRENSRKVAIESSHNRYFTDGVRAPLLSDITSRQSCRLEVIRPKQLVTQDQTESLSSQESPGRKTVIPQMIPLDRESTNVSNFEKVSNSNKSMKYLLPNGLLRSNDETEMTSRSASDLDFRWKKYKNKVNDARDVLYRNTYCKSPGKIRYHNISLPSIASQNQTSVPTVGKTKAASKKNIFSKEPDQSHSKIHEIGVQETKHNVTSNPISAMYEVGFLKVQKIKSHSEDIPNGHSDLFLTVRQPTDIYSKSSSRSELKTERPLKHEAASPYSSRMYRKHSTYRNMMKYSLRDYKSADAYKEYLENIKIKMEMHNEVNTRAEIHSVFSQFGRENRCLQSVIDVNTPKEVFETTLSQDNKSLVIEIKPTWKEIPNGLADDVDSDDRSTCPVTSPLRD